MMHPATFLIYKERLVKGIIMPLYLSICVTNTAWKFVLL